MHKSKHNHAIRRPRGPGGRFLTAAKMKATKDGRIKGMLSAAASTKRKADTDISGSDKRARETPPLGGRQGMRIVSLLKGGPSSCLNPLFLSYKF